MNKVLIPVYMQSHVDSLLNALQENSTVTSLVLELADVCSETDPSFATLLQYLKNSTTIRSVELARCRDSGLSSAVSTRIVLALAENRSMELVEFESGVSLDCNDLTALIDSKAHCLQCLHVPYPSYDEGVLRWMQVVQAVGSLQVLESVYIPLRSENTERMLEKLHGHPCLRKLYLKQIDIDCNMLTVEAVSLFLQSQVQLETLELMIFGWHGDSIESLMQGLRACQTLENLTLWSNYFPVLHVEDCARAFGDGVRKCRSIRQLRIDCSQEWQPLRPFLVRQPSLRPLRY
jgi:hypothetical protein